MDLGLRKLHHGILKCTIPNTSHYVCSHSTDTITNALVVEWLGIHEQLCIVPVTNEIQGFSYVDVGRSICVSYP